MRYRQISIRLVLSLPLNAAVPISKPSRRYPLAKILFSNQLSFLYVEKKKDYLGGLQDSAEADCGETLYSPFKLYKREDEMQIKQHRHEMYQRNCSGMRDFAWIHFVFMLK